MLSTTPSPLRSQATLVVVASDAVNEFHEEPVHCLTKVCCRFPTVTSFQTTTGEPPVTANPLCAAFPLAGFMFRAAPRGDHAAPVHFDTYNCVVWPRFDCSSQERNT